MQQGGEEEACMAVLNNFYGDGGIMRFSRFYFHGFISGIKWHDVACHHEKPIICEDEPGHLQFVLGK